MNNYITIDQLLTIANEILLDEDLPSIEIDDDLQTHGFSSMNILMLIIRIEKAGHNMSNIAVESISSLRELHYKIINKVSDRTII